MAEYTDPEVFVFLDESAVDEATAEQRWGRSLLGTCCVPCKFYMGNSTFCPTGINL